ncbi:MAG: sensor histidine kinase KdpD [Firmicutes bacterium]|nr:sensor histidine kinase KdpD [Bacillota bacterium]
MTLNQVERADPDALLAGLKDKSRGTLTIFLGAAAGVGKTYAMLQAARERMAEGVDLLVGWVETHGRPETEVLLAGLPVVPPIQVEYRGKPFSEMDLDKLLARKPKLALVDELAHTNVTGRHAKRYQDVEELLAAGINVYTTLNIQHLESLNDVVARITGMVVRETLPDRILERAEIHVIDIPPDDLIQRFKEGKVYVPDKAREALDKFFRPGNINALRELALRFTAQRVDRQLETYMRAHAIPGPWPVGERIMVCVSASPFSAQLIRLGSRIASSLQAEWLAVYIETPRRLPAGDAERDRLTKNLRLAEQLGGQTVVTTGQDVAEELLEIARKRNVTQLIIGRPLHSKLWEWIHGSVVDNLIHKSEGISVHVISGRSQPEGLPRYSVFPRQTRQLYPYLFTFVMIAAVTVLAKWLEPDLGLVNVAMLYLLPVLLSAVSWGLSPGVFASVLGILAFDYLFVPPTLRLTVADLRHLISFSIFLLVALLTGSISTRLRQQVSLSKQRESRMAAIQELSREITVEVDLKRLLNTAAKSIAQSMEGQVVIFLPDKEDALNITASTASRHEVFLDEKEKAVVKWVFEQGQVAGWGTETLAGSNGIYVPLVAESRAIGVLGVWPFDTGQPLSNEKRLLLDALGSFTAMAINRVQLGEKAKESQLLADSERLRNALLNSISHELRTPLTSITGAVTGLLEEGEVYPPEARRDLLKSIKQGAVRMERVVNNLLDMARLESGFLKLNRDWCDIQDIIGVAVRRLEALRQWPLRIDIEPNLPLLYVDFVLIEQVIVNLLDNAVKYSERVDEITVSARRVEGMVEIRTADRGSGIPGDQLEQVFDKFYRLKTSRKTSGVGLGLTICRAMVEAHGGRIRAENNPGGGAVITFTLPLNENLLGELSPLEEGA